MLLFDISRIGNSFYPTYSWCRLWRNPERSWLLNTAYPSATTDSTSKLFIILQWPINLGIIKSVVNYCMFNQYICVRDAPSFQVVRTFISHGWRIHACVTLVFAVLRIRNYYILAATTGQGFVTSSRTHLLMPSICTIFSQGASFPTSTGSWCTLHPMVSLFVPR